jgi:hypothetical protein
VAVVSALKALVNADPVEALTKRLAAVESEAAAAQNERSKAEADLFAAETAGSDARSADAAERHAAAEKKLSLLTLRRAAVQKGLAEARTSKTSADRLVRIDALEVLAVKSTKAANVAEETLIEGLIHLGESLASWKGFCAAESEAVAALAREQPDPPHGRPGRYLSAIEGVALRRGNTLSSLEIKVPLI